MNTPRRLILTASLIATLASIAPLASAADTSPQNHGTTMDQVHRPRDVFTDGARNSARDPYLDGAHQAAER
ncbi:putative alpha/beta hydrolase family esterase [Cupriavidus metallidurans]|jgi:predicted alpha/beta hydrolase family esterase|uniref:Hydroxyquinol 1,2-dioxygenase n=1 Tax=Cupriavidus metallidurans TaxID=119219 RepID=A0A482IKV0_9BURK|nr:hypothetical protein DDF84_008105 [Cupriavidus metallidurans]